MRNVEQPAKILYDSISNLEKLEQMINEGYTESLHLECKSHLSPVVGREMKAKLAEALSGFSNTEGGVYIFGVATSNRVHQGLDVLIQIETIPNIENFRRQIENAIPPLTIPSITRFQTKILKRRNRDTAGVLLLYIPRYGSKPVQALPEELFHFRSGHDFIKAPYTIIEHLFAVSETPMLELHAEQHSYDEATEMHSISLVLANNSLGAAEHVAAHLRIVNQGEIESVTTGIEWNDVSDINPGTRSFGFHATNLIYFGLSLNTGRINFKLKPKKRKVILEISVYANKMVPIIHTLVIHFFTTKMKVVASTSSNIVI